MFIEENVNEEYLEKIIEVLALRIGLGKRISAFIEYSDPFNFSLKSYGESKSKTILTLTEVFESCNSVEDSDPLYLSEDEVLEDLKVHLGNHYLFTIARELRNRYDVVCISKDI